MAAVSIPKVASLPKLRELIKAQKQSGGATAVGLLFAADWVPAVAELREAVSGLQQALPNIQFVEVEDSAQDMLDAFEVKDLPTTLLMGDDKVERIVGRNIPAIVAAARQMSKALSDKQAQQAPQQQQAIAARQDDSPNAQPAAAAAVNKPQPVQDAGKLRGDPLNDRLAALVKARPVVLFMKGSPEEPRCGFSNRIVGLLKQLGIQRYGYFDILGDEEVRQGLKEFSDWPTYPQLYFRGELVAGLDVFQEMIQQQDPTIKEMQQVCDEE